MSTKQPQALFGRMFDGEEDADIIGYINNLMSETEILVSMCFSPTRTNYSGLKTVCFLVVVDAHMPLGEESLHHTLKLLNIPPAALWEAVRSLQGLYRIPDSPKLIDMIRNVAAVLLEDLITSKAVHSPVKWN
ncbi:MAG TPA: hypothetical protein VKK79_09565 [Candidatus Lokiarchaeia archaeon]|nr:hypothetical protein [Candidatus Lokiarchaeia archaeon]